MFTQTVLLLCLLCVFFVSFSIAENPLIVELEKEINKTQKAIVEVEIENKKIEKDIEDVVEKFDKEARLLEDLSDAEDKEIAADTQKYKDLFMKIRQLRNEKPVIEKALKVLEKDVEKRKLLVTFLSQDLDILAERRTDGLAEKCFAQSSKFLLEVRSSLEEEEENDEVMVLELELENLKNDLKGKTFKNQELKEGLKSTISTFELTIKDLKEFTDSKMKQELKARKTIEVFEKELKDLEENAKYIREKTDELKIEKQEITLELNRLRDRLEEFKEDRDCYKTLERDILNVGHL